MSHVDSQPIKPFVTSRLPGLPALQELRAQTYALARHFSEHPSALPIFIGSKTAPDWEIEACSPASLRAIYEEGREQLRRVLSHSVQSDLVRPLPLDLLTDLYLAVLQVSFHDQFRRDQVMDVPACVDQTMAFFLDGTRWRD